MEDSRTEENAQVIRFGMRPVQWMAGSSGEQIMREWTLLPDPWARLRSMYAAPEKSPTGMRQQTAYIYSRRDRRDDA